MTQEQEIHWSKNLIGTLTIGGTWAVPRSGLIFKKVSETELALDNLMPWMEEIGRGFEWGFDVPPTKEKLIEYQRGDFIAISSRFEAAGLKMTDPKELLGLTTA